MTSVSTAQIAIVSASAACFAAATGLSIARQRLENRLKPDSRLKPDTRLDPKLESGGLRLIAKVLTYAGLLLAVGVLVWHSAQRQTWLPLGDNFATLVFLGVLLAGFVLYMQVHRPLRGLDWFLLPIVIVLFVAAMVFGSTKPHEYVDTTWSVVHRITAYGGAVAFAVAGAAGLMFLVANYRLKHALSGPGPNFGSLERLENLTLVAVALGLGLLTIGAVTGLVKIAGTAGSTRLGEHWFMRPKIFLACGVWLVYAVVLHSPINPSFRGRRAAVLSVVGFLLMIGTLVAVQFVPAK